MGRSGRSQGGIIGKVNNTSFGKCKVTAVTATGNFTTQPGTGVVLSAVIAGGGMGGIGDMGGGGGAGGVLVTCSTGVCGATAYPATIGGGGAATTQPGPAGTAPTTQNNGTNSSITFGPVTLTAIGGGAAGTGPPTSPAAPGAPGGSGGGGGYSSSAQGTGGTGTACQGYDGGDALFPGLAMGGGGGAGAVGTDGTGAPPNSVGGPGGAGRDLTPFFGCAPQPFYIANGPNAGASVGGIFAGGGGGSAEQPNCAAGCGGTGGGGNGSQSPGNTGAGAGDGVANTGGAGGGVQLSDPGGTGKAGGSGIVLIKEAALSGVNASGMWSMEEQYTYSLEGSWQG